MALTNKATATLSRPVAWQREENLPMHSQCTTPTFGDPRLPPRFWAKVLIGSVPTQRPDLGPCWECVGARYWNEYGAFWWEGRVQRAHRVAFLTLIGPISEKLEPDHLCRNRPCVYPTHVEVVTRRENIMRGNHYHRRKTHCLRGHPYDEMNTYRYKTRRDCKACHQDRNRKWWEKAKG